MSAISTFPYHMELIDGVEVEKPLPKKLHALIEGYLLWVFHQALPKSHEALPELNVLCGADRLVPDVTVMERTANYVDGDLADPPLLAIEILSPGQTFENMLDKCERLLNAGTAACWLIWPERRRAWTFTSADALQEAHELVLEVADSRIVVALPEMWHELD